MGEMAQPGREFIWVSEVVPYTAFLCHGRNQAVQEENWGFSAGGPDMPGAGSSVPQCLSGSQVPPEFFTFPNYRIR